MSSLSEKTPDSPPARGFGWPQAIAVVACSLALLIALGMWLFFRTAQRTGELVLESGAQVVAKVEAIARAFRSGTITTTFISYATEVSGSNYLQFARLNQTELFERKDTATALWGQLELPDVVVEAVASVEYTYFLDLDGPWTFELEGHRVLVSAPEIAFNKPAVDPSTLRYQVRQDSLLRNEEAALEQLKKGLSGMAQARAIENIELVREMGRRKTAEFVANWLLQGFGESAEDYDVHVIFAGERADRSTAVRVLERDGSREFPASND